jgi:hypothetical protein
MVIDSKPVTNPEDNIRNVLWPFEHFLYKRRINVYMATRLSDKV